MSTFVLVHGAFLGGFCWDLLVPELARFGHRSIAIDLPIEVPELGAETYAEVTVRAIKSAMSEDEINSQPPVLVGHSMGGLIIPLVAHQLKVSALIYLAAALPMPGCSFMQRAKTTETDVFLTEGDVNPYLNRELAGQYWFHDCQPDVSAWATAKIRAQNSAKIIFEDSPLKSLPAVPMHSIVGAQERLLSPVWGRRMSKELLGIDSIDVAAGHCPQISQPSVVAKLLNDMTLA
jgi:pimeloyl-ACP methyl ester carboxylesterase